MKQSKYLRMFFAEPDDVGGIADVEVTELQEPEPVVPVTTKLDDEPGAQPVIDYEKMAASMTGALASAFPKAEPQVTAPRAALTQPEIDKLLKKWEPDDAFVEKFSNIATQKDAIKELFTRATEHAEALAQVHTYSEIQRLQTQFGPSLAAAQQAQADAREARFNATYPELSTPALKPVIAAVATELFRTKKFASESEAFDAVAKGAEGIIKTHAPEFKLTKTPIKVKGNPNALPVTTGGSGGGGSSPRVEPKVAGPRGIDLFPKVGK